MINGLVLYQITGEAKYLTDVKGISTWVHDHLFNPTTGEVHGCWGFKTAGDTTGYLQKNGDDNAYNDGTFIQAADALYRMTGNGAYHQDALLVVNHRVTTNVVLHTNDEGGGSEWAYPFVKALGQFTTTSTGGDGGIAVVQEPFSNARDSLWTLVPTNGGYYRIQNVSSAQAGALVVALPIAKPAQGNEQGLPVVNSDGSYSFYNLSSILALEDPGASTAAGTQLGQWFGNGTTEQAFQLISHQFGGASDAGAIDGEGPTADASTSVLASTDRLAAHLRSFLTRRPPEGQGKWRRRARRTGARARQAARSQPRVSLPASLLFLRSAPLGRVAAGGGGDSEGRFSPGLPIEGIGTQLEPVGPGQPRSGTTMRHDRCARSERSTCPTSPVENSSSIRQSR